MLNAAMILSTGLSVICIGLWMSSQGEEQNAHSLWVKSEPAVSAKNLAAYQKVRKERLCFGLIGLALGLAALISAVLRARQ
jgi:hypothetical protein